MKLPSFRRILDSALSTVKRFPLMICCIIIGTVTSILGIDDTMRDYDDICLKITLFCLLGFPVLLAVPIIIESLKWKKFNSIIIQLGAAALLFVYYYFAPMPDDFKLLDTVVFMVLLISSVLVATYSPFFFRNSQTGLWQFNRRVISRGLTSILYSFTLFAGISLAILAIHFLFNIKVPEERYAQLFFLIFGLFATWFLAADIPQDIDELNQDQTYPKGLKIFVQYILLPLVSLYFIILYAYACRILVLWELPKGWVSYLVLALAAIGILVFLFVWPVKEDGKKNNWIKIYSRYFYILMVPLVVLLFVAIGRRISDYGVTPLRYYVFILALWLSVTIFYFVFSKKKNIKWLPVSLTVLALLSIVGPWSAFKVSKRSQIARLETILEENKVFVNGKIDTSHVVLSDSIEVEINQILRFLSEAKELKSLQKRWDFSLEDPENSQDEIDQYSASKALGLRNTSTYFDSGSDDSTYFSFYSNNSVRVKISGYDYSSNDKSVYYHDEVDYYDDTYFNIADKKYTLGFSKNGNSLDIREDGKLVFQKDLYPAYQQLKSKGFLSDYQSSSESPENEQSFEIDEVGNGVKFIIKTFNGNTTSDSTVKMSYATFDILVKDKSAQHPKSE